MIALVRGKREIHIVDATPSQDHAPDVARATNGLHVPATIMEDGSAAVLIADLIEALRNRGGSAFAEEAIANTNDDDVLYDPSEFRIL